jgi:hypothetical protein
MASFQPAKRGEPMVPTVVDENRYFNLVAGIAALNDCKVLDINFQDRVINLNGSPKAVGTCSAELEEVLGRYQTG